jgi:pSer/pThr/pTyr-binding forkhead associated (FHA) protein
MGFQLVISEGKEAGREFVFDQDSVLIGRTSECDVILYDPGVSRRHARIYVENGQFFVEDVGSSNGTQVNGELVKKQSLKDGDSISLGPVVFAFKPTELEPATAEEQVADGGAHTRIVSASELKRSRNKGVALLPKGADRQEVEQLGRRGTAVLPALKGPRPSAPSGARGSGSRRSVERRSDPAMARGGLSGDERRGLVRSSRGGGEKLSAADRARLKREGPLGLLKIFWAEASKPKRIVLASIAGLVGLGLAGGLVAAVIPSDHKPKPKEPVLLSADPVEQSFGLGQTVTFERPDQKTFEFQVVAPVQVMVVLHYQCSDISKDEVSVAVNGVEVGWLPPDTLAINEVTHELLVPANLIKRNDINFVTFDNVKNPPGADPWKIWNIWVEVAVLPEKDEQGLIADAEEKFERGRKKWDQKDIGATNRWEAYKNFREAWLTLEALPPQSRPATYELARQKMNEAKAELDLKCNQLLLEARTAYNLKQYEQADFALKHVNEFFPTRAHPCPMRAENERYEFDL